MRLPDMEREESAAGDGAGEAGAAGTNPGMTDETGENTTGPSGVSGQGHSGKSRRSGSGKRIAVILGIAAAAVILIVAANLLMGISGGGGIYTGDYDGLAELDEEHVVLDEETGIEYIDNTILVFTQAGLTDRQKRSIASSVDGVVIGEYEGMAGLLQIEVESSSLSELDELAADLEENDLVWFSSYDFLLDLVYEDGSDETAEVLKQGDWWEDAINIERTWEEFGDCFGDINIGVIDSAIDTTQSDVSGKIAFPTTSIELRNQANQANAAHGTAVTALIVADRDGSGVDGIADQAVVYFCSGSSSFSNVSEGIMKLADSGCRVINNSYCIEYDSYDYSDTAWAAISAEKIGAISNGMISSGWDGLFVQSAGNQAINTYEVGLWATYKHAHSDLDNHILIVTGAEENETQTGYQLSDGYAYGEDVDICAPGVGIAVPSNGTYSNGSGTSFSAPMVTAVAGLIWSADPDMTAAEVKSCLLNGYRFELTSSVSGDTYPMLDAYNAVQRALYCAFEGTVEYEDGTPAEGITVLAVDENGETLNDAVTDENGCYVINCSRLAVDHLSFYVGGEEAETLEIADEYRAYDADAAKGDTESGYDPHDMEVVVLPLRQTDIYVKGWDGTILEDASVILTDSRGEEYEAAAQTDSSGSAFYQAFVPAGEYTIEISADDYESLVETAAITADIATLEYTLEVVGEISWDFDEDTGVLTISGTGAMDNYEEWESPWASVCFEVRSIVVEDGVTRIGEYAFYGCVFATEAVIADSVTTIGDFAFRECYSLLDLTLPDDTAISDSAFYGCESLPVTEDGFVIVNTLLVDYTGDALEISVPDGITRIGYWAFHGMYDVTSITLPDSVTELAEESFSSCRSITSLVIPEGVTRIGDYAFNGCRNLAEISIPSTVTDIGENVFNFCTSLDHITVADGNTAYRSEDGALYTADMTVLIKCPTTISGTYYVRDGVLSLARDAFADCTEVTTIVLPSGLTTIAVSAFDSCSLLEGVSLADSVTEIGSYAFSDCSSLKEIYIPENVTSLGDQLFRDCAQLASIEVASGNPVYSSSDGVLYSKDQQVLIRCPQAWEGDYEIPDTVTIIGEYAFEGCTLLTAVSIPDSVTSIGRDAFHQCESLTSVCIPVGVTQIGVETFYYCSALSDITIEGDVTSIEVRAFMKCDMLTSIYIPDSVTFIGVNAFSSSLTDVYYEGTQEQWEQIEIDYLSSHVSPLITSATIHYNSSR